MSPPGSFTEHLVCGGTVKPDSRTGDRGPRRSQPGGRAGRPVLRAGLPDARALSVQNHAGFLQAELGGDAAFDFQCSCI